MQRQAWVQSAIAALMAWGHVTQAAGQSVEAETDVAIVLSLQSASDECLPRAELERQVRRRSARIEFSDVPGVQPRHVSVSATDAGVPGQVGVTLDFGAETNPRHRRLNAATCDELAQAVGFVIALTFDPPSAQPGQQNNEETPKDEPSAAPLPRPKMSSAPVDDPVDEVPSWALGSAAGPTPPLDLAVGLGPVSVFGPVPNAMFGAEAHFTAAFRGAAALRIDLSWVGGGVVRSDVGRAEFSLMTVGVAACPLSLGEGTMDGGRLAVRPCVSGAFGALRASGSSTNQPEAHQRPFTALGGAILLDYRLSPRWQLSANLAWRGALVRDRFQFEPQIVHRVPPWAASASLAAALVF